MFKVTYRVFGQTRSFVRGDGPDQIGTQHVNPAAFVDVTVYTNLVKADGGVDMKAMKGHIRKEIGDTYYEFREIVKVGETI